MRVALLQNFVAPYRVPFYERLREHVGELKIFISTPMESDRDWAVEWGTLDVAVQRNVTVRRLYQDDFGFARELQIHLPYDTLGRLFALRPDVVISVELGARSLQAAFYRLLRPGVKLVIWCKLSEHSERNWGWRRTMLRRFILARADGVLVNGESGARYIARFGVPDRRIFRINQPVDGARFQMAQRDGVQRDGAQRGETQCEGADCNGPREQSRPGSTRRLLCAGTLTARKGLMPLLQQLAAWGQEHPEQAVEIWWLGNGELRLQMEAFALPSNVTQHFCGSVPYADTPSYYAQCDILVFPSLLDEWGLVVNEAMAAGLPVCGSIYAQAVTELVAHGINGWIFDPGEPDQMAAVLAQAIATTPQELARLGRAARQRIGLLTPDSAARKIAAALYELA